MVIRDLTADEVDSCKRSMHSRYGLDIDHWDNAKVNRLARFVVGVSAKCGHCNADILTAFVQCINSGRLPIKQSKQKEA